MQPLQPIKPSAGTTNNDFWLECFTQPVSQPDSHPPMSQHAASPGGKDRRPCTYSTTTQRTAPPVLFAPLTTHWPLLDLPLHMHHQAWPSHMEAPGHHNHHPSTTQTQPLPHSCHYVNKGVRQRHTFHFRHVCITAAAAHMGRGTAPIPIDQQKLVTPLRPLQLKCELCNHPLFANYFMISDTAADRAHGWPIHTSTAPKPTLLWLWSCS